MVTNFLIKISFIVNRRLLELPVVVVDNLEQALDAVVNEEVEHQQAGGGS